MNYGRETRWDGYTKDRNHNPEQIHEKHFKVQEIATHFLNWKRIFRKYKNTTTLI